MALQNSKLSEQGTAGKRKRNFTMPKKLQIIWKPESGKS
jgi:hypothetical protein